MYAPHAELVPDLDWMLQSAQVSDEALTETLIRDYAGRVAQLATSILQNRDQALEVVRAAGRDNVGLVIDFWHLWAAGETLPAEVAGLDRRLIYGIHFCDGKKPADPTQAWDELALRSYLPGAGDVPIQEWVAAVKATGYDGSWSSELISPRHWEWELGEVARQTRELMAKYIQ